MNLEIEKEIPGCQELTKLQQEIEEEQILISLEIINSLTNSIKTNKKRRFLGRLFYLFLLFYQKPLCFCLSASCAGVREASVPGAGVGLILE